jgi:hypothetical protein
MLRSCRPHIAENAMYGAQLLGRLAIIMIGPPAKAHQPALEFTFAQKTQPSRTIELENEHSMRGASPEIRDSRWKKTQL